MKNYNVTERLAMVSRVKDFRQKLLLLSFTVIFMAILAEIVLRILLPPPILWKHPQETYIYDPQIGHWLEPGQDSYTHITNQSALILLVYVNPNTQEVSPPGFTEYWHWAIRRHSVMGWKRAAHGQSSLKHYLTKKILKTRLKF